jgi:hypothetical protein
VPEPEFVEITEDEPGSVEWLDEDLGAEPETPHSDGSPLRRSFRRGKPRIAVLATAVAAVLGATTVILHVNHAFGPWPNPRTVPVGSVDWRAAPSGTSVGMWTTSDSVVVATQHGLTAYSLAHGQHLWSWAPPAGEGLCAISPTTSQSIGVVAYGPLHGPDSGISQITVGDGSSSGSTIQELNCTDAQAVDIGTGKAAWAKPVDLTQGSELLLAGTAANDLSISAGYVVAPYGEDGLMSLNAATGATLWTSDQLPESPVSNQDTCYDGAQALDGDVYAVVANCFGPNGVDGVT